MKKIILIIILLSINNVSSQTLEELYKKVSSSVVYIDIVSFDYSNAIISQNISKEASSGSGVLVSNDGLIWTASHVVQSAEEISVEFNDGDIYEAEVIASNPNADVALIKIKGDFKLRDKYIPKIGDSDLVEIGQNIFFIGAPYGFKQSLSKGVVSGKFEPESLSNAFEPVEFLQTDAAINPGNSGGPMFDMDGNIVGIASRIYSISGGFDGIGFAISSNVAKKLLSEKSTLWTGMDALFLSPEMAKLLNVPQEAGLLILQLSTKGAAARLGLLGGIIPVNIAGKELMLGGDIILKVAGIKITNKNDLYLIKKKISSTQVGDDITITILRQGMVEVIEFLKE